MIYIIMNKKIIEKIAEMLIELGKPLKREVGFVEAKRIISDGLALIGLDANDILGFVKAPNEIKIRKVRGSQAWFKKMYEDGWKYAGNFEYEGLINNGYVVMEREIPNKVLDAIREELEFLLKDDSVERHKDSDSVLRAEGKLKLINSDVESVVPKGLDEKLEAIKKFGAKVVYAKPPLIPKAVKEPREGFEPDIENFMIEAQKDLKTEEEQFFEATGKNAVWHGKETKAFTEWKKENV